MLSFWNQPRSLKKKKRNLSVGMLLARCLFEIAFFEGDAFLKSMSQQLKLNQTLALHTHTQNCQDLNYNPLCDAQTLESMVRTLTAWVVDMLKAGVGHAVTQKVHIYIDYNSKFCNNYTGNSLKSSL